MSKVTPSEPLRACPAGHEPMPIDLYDSLNHHRRYWRHCRCGRSGPAAPTPAEANAAWNRRAESGDSARLALLERIREAASRLENRMAAILGARGVLAEVGKPVPDLGMSENWWEHTRRIDYELLDLLPLADQPPRAESGGEGMDALGDAIRIARGCLDYGGGHRNDGHLDAFHHGIETACNALEAARTKGLADPQVRALHRMGAPGAAPAPERKDGHDA